MRVRDIKQIVNRTAKEMETSLSTIVKETVDKTVLELNSKESIARRSQNLADSVLRPSKSEQERILGQNDLVDLNFFERGLFAAKSVCRVILCNEAGRQIGVASGFMVSPKLMLTNHHVFPRASEAVHALAQFDYSLDLNGVERRGASFRIRPDLYFFAQNLLDFAVVAVDDHPNESGHPARISDYRFLRLNPQLGKINAGEFISIIQHPSGLPKQVALRENKLLGIETDFLVYSSDTAQGSSGSPLFNDTWQVVGLHSAGVPKKNLQGQWLTKSGSVANDDTDDGDINWIGNRGSRASRIINALRQAPSDPLLSELLAIADSGSEVYSQPQNSSVDRNLQQKPSAITSVRIHAAEGGARIELPVGYVADIGFGSLPTANPVIQATQPLPAAFDDLTDTIGVEAYKAPVVDTNYSNRKGYDADFLNESISLPSVTKKSLAAKMDNGEIVIPYEHFSIVMHKKRRLAIFTACNIDTREKSRRPDASKAYTRAALGGLSKNDVEMWVEEPRIETIHQLPDAFFKNDRKSFDKGHVVRRDDVVWGRTYAQVRRANGDTFHVTNCSPQVAAFNQSSKGGDWGLLENMILRQAKDEKVVVFAGPIFDDARDKPFKGEDENSDELIVQIPSQYWKIVVANGPDGLEAYGFVLKQDLKSVVWEFDIEADWVSELKPILDIQALTDLIKFPKNVIDADMYGFVEVEESLAIGEIQRKLPVD
jgi:endonuclease G